MPLSIASVGRFHWFGPSKARSILVAAQLATEQQGRPENHGPSRWMVGTAYATMPKTCPDTPWVHPHQAMRIVLLKSLVVGYIRLYNYIGTGQRKSLDLSQDFWGVSIGEAVQDFPSDLT